MKVLFIVLDTLRADHLGCYGYSRQTSPNIDAFSRKATTFLNAYPSDIPTQPSYTAMFTGKRGINTGIVSHSYIEQLSDRIPFIPMILAKNGYTTAAVSSLFIFKKYFARGFQTYMNPVAGTPSRIQQVNGDEINMMAIPWIESHKDDDFFLFLHYWDPHCIYFPPIEEYRSMFYEADKDPCNPNNHSLDKARELPSWSLYRGHLEQISRLNNFKKAITDKDFVESQYDGEIKYTDDRVGEILEKLEDLQISQETMIIITSDHGESMGSHNVYFDHCTTHEHTAHVPLIIKHPSLSGNKKVEALVQLVDLAPTIFDFLNIQPLKEFEGKSLFPLLSQEEKEGYKEVFSNQGLWTAQRMMRNKRWKLIKTLDKTAWDFPERELYDLSKDPLETHNLAEEKKDIADEMEFQMQVWLNKELKNRPDPLRIIAGTGNLAGTRLRKRYEIEKKGKASPSENQIESSASFVNWRMRIDKG